MAEPIDICYYLCTINVFSTGSSFYCLSGEVDMKQGLPKSEDWKIVFVAIGAYIFVIGGTIMVVYPEIQQAFTGLILRFLFG